MDIIELKEKEGIFENEKSRRIFDQYQKLLNELRKKELPHKIIESANQDIDDLNSTSFTGKELKKMFKRKQGKLIELLEKELKIVPKNYYRNRWLAGGMFIFGLPIGFLFGLILFEDQSLISIGLPVGMSIGICFGSIMDKKAFKEGRQLDVKIKY
ncbi:hypothetical protein FACS1894142_5410 [Spirochaetia bacterium]|nr:hypothetical protein FACS1894142_5410 [Spirochaetia bacterium]